MAWAAPGLLRVRQRVRVEEREPGGDATGPYWVFAVVRVESGGIGYLHGDARVAPPGRSFAVFMPPWSIVLPDRTTCVASTAALVSRTPAFEGAPSTAVAWPWRGGDPPASVEAIARTVRGGGGFVDISREADPTPAARRAKVILDESYDRPVTLATLAAQAGLSASVLSRAFSRDYGMPPVQYRHRLRVMDAMFRLAAGERILPLLHDVGFGDAGRFYAQFRSLLCAPPGSYAARRSRNAKT